MFATISRPRRRAELSEQKLYPVSTEHSSRLLRNIPVVYMDSASLIYSLDRLDLCMQSYFYLLTGPPVSRERVSILIREMAGLREAAQVLYAASTLSNAKVVLLKETKTISPLQAFLSFYRRNMGLCISGK